jgi:YidC/Oxa1 family membrane protein insertase
MPTPGSVAHKAREERLAKKGKLPKQAEIEVAEEETPRQRVQPVGKARAKKPAAKPAAKPASTTKPSTKPTNKPKN